MDKPPSSVRFALGLAAILLLVALSINFSRPAATFISSAQFRRFSARGAIGRIELTPVGLRCQLVRAVRLAAVGPLLLPPQILVVEGMRPSAAEVAAWRAGGMVVEVEGVTGEREWPGLALVALLLAMGMWYLWRQARRNRGAGSPRQRLEALECAFEQGRCTAEEYRQRAQDLWAEM